MFKIQFLDDLDGCDPEQKNDIDEMSRKKFLSRIVEYDPFEKTKTECNNKEHSKNNKKLIFLNISDIGYNLKGNIDIVNNVIRNKYRRAKIRRRKRAF